MTEKANEWPDLCTSHNNMTLSLSQETKQRVEELRRLGDKRGFTLAYQTEQENNPNQICHKRRAPATDEKYDRAVLNWKL